MSWAFSRGVDCGLLATASGVFHGLHRGRSGSRLLQLSAYLQAPQDRLRQTPWKHPPKRQQHPPTAPTNNYELLTQACVINALMNSTSSTKHNTCLRLRLDGAQRDKIPSTTAASRGGFSGASSGSSSWGWRKQLGRARKLSVRTDRGNSQRQCP